MCELFHVDTYFERNSFQTDDYHTRRIELEL